MAVTNFDVQPFSVLPGLNAINQGVGAMHTRQQEEKSLVEQKMMSQGLANAIQSQDPDAVFQFVANNPGSMDMATKMTGFANEATKNSMVNTARRILMGGADPGEAMVDHVSTVMNEGGDPTQSEIVARESIQNPEYGRKQAEMALALYDPEGYKAYKKAMGEGDGKSFDKTTKLRKEFSDQSKDYIKQNASFGRVQASANNPSAAGDLALIFNYMKLLDPGSTVREGEFATAQNSAGVPERIRAKLNEVIRGERLAPEQRSDFYSRAIDLFAEANRQHQKLKSRYSNLAKRNDLPSEDVVIDFLTADQDREVNLSVGETPEGFELMEDASGNKAYVNPQTGEIKEL